MNFLNPDDFSFLKSIKDGFSDIKAEYDAIASNSVPWMEPHLYNGNWSVIGFKYEGKGLDDNKKLAPKTCSIFDAHSDIIHTYGFSILKPGTEIHPHENEDKDADKFLRGHLAIYSNDDAALVVNGEAKNWVPGELIVFDDKIMHSAHNRGTTDRVVVLFDFFK